MNISTLYRSINDLHAALPRLLNSGYAFPPLRVGCVLTHRCNLRCSMCFVWKHGDKDLAGKELNTQDWLKIFKQIPGFSIITFTGGEPLVRKDLPELLKAACRNHRVHLVSNGTMLNEETIQMIMDSAAGSMFGKGLLSIGVSLEGPRDVHDQMVNVPGAFDKTTTALKRIVDLKRQQRRKYPILDLKIVICKETLGSLVALYDIADEIGLDLISYQQCSTQESSYGIDDANPQAMNTVPPPVDPIPRETLLREISDLKNRALKGKTELRFNPDMPPEDFASRYENRFPLKQFTCSAAWSVMHIGPYGTVFPCFSTPMGNVRDSSLMKIWNGNPYREFRTKIRKAKIFPGCIGCCVMKKSSKM